MLDIPVSESASKPEDDLLDIAEKATARCGQCGENFVPRDRSGGKPQRFCSPPCRSAFHAQRGQRESSHVGEMGASAAVRANRRAP